VMAEISMPNYGLKVYPPSKYERCVSLGVAALTNSATPC
jgi:hypothetical protein